MILFVDSIERRIRSVSVYEGYSLEIVMDREFCLGKTLMK